MHSADAQARESQGPLHKEGLLLPSEIAEYLASQLTSPIAVQKASVKELKSAQQTVLLLTFGDCESNLSVLSNPDWSQSLNDGNNRLVVRIWKGASRWWNLNQQQQRQPDRPNFADELLPHESPVHQLARSEIAGYRIARRALCQQESNAIRIPRVLAFSLELPTKKGSESEAGAPACWSIMEYVGKASTHYVHVQTWDDAWATCMVKVRDEFGYTEPHPRWGRVPVNDSLEYATAVLRQVTIPLHKHFRSLDADQLSAAVRGLSGVKREPIDSSNTFLLHGYSYLDMVRFYQAAHTRMEQALKREEASWRRDIKLVTAVELLERAIIQLHKEAMACKLDQPSLQPVLVHMDCQPQNLMFANVNNVTRVASVLDWEEAAFADPRFELLLSCRKVCANREQADKVWDLYRKELPEPNLGPIDPWLKLETVHSLTTLLLQSMDLLGGGRSPWETKPDLGGKIEREFGRLSSLGWEFCNAGVLKVDN